jgi:SAM-dependent methyltransferase
LKLSADSAQKKGVALDGSEGCQQNGIPLSAGREAFGGDPNGYETARPDYPPMVAARLKALCPAPGTHCFEVGSGTGMATRLLLDLEPACLVAIEPDKRLADYLRNRFSGEIAGLEIANCSFEKIDLPAGTFGLGAAATSFHWLEQETALAKVFALLRSGGSWTMWWNVFGDLEHPDEYEQATTPLFRKLTPSPSWTYDGRSPFGLDETLRRAQMQAAGFEKIEFHHLCWTLRMDTKQAVGLAATFSQVSMAEPERRAWFLSELAELMERQFGGCVERRFSTAFYSAQKP